MCMYEKGCKWKMVIHILPELYLLLYLYTFIYIWKYIGKALVICVLPFFIYNTFRLTINSLNNAWSHTDLSDAMWIGNIKNMVYIGKVANLQRPQFVANRLPLDHLYHTDLVGWIFPGVRIKHQRMLPCCHPIHMKHCNGDTVIDHCTIHNQHT